MQSFVHLHLHTQYSLLDGAIRIKDLVKRAQEWNLPALAQTDHGNMFGAIDFYTKCKSAGIKPLIGAEIYITPGSRFERKVTRTNSEVLNSQDEEESKHHIHHLVLLCKDLQGYQNLCKIISQAYMEGFYYKPRADKQLLRQYSEGLIALSACLKGEIGHNFFIGQDDLAHAAIKDLSEIYRDNFYLEIQENGLEEQRLVNQKITAYARTHGLPLVATNDCHYLDRDDSLAQEVLLCIQTGKTFGDEKRMKLTTSEFYFKSPQEMRAAFKDYPEACDNTLRIADQCNLNLKWTDEKGRQIYHLPDFPITTEEDTNQYFARTSREGLAERFQGPHFSKLRANPRWESELKPQYEQRLEDEIEMIIRTGFAGYFLIVSDFIVWSKRQKVAVGPGRGSGAGSLVAYALNITNVNPIPYNLLFERFINPERISMPDFDIDFCQDRRQEVIDYVTQKYGTERVGQIITFGKLQAKAVIRDVSRVFGLAYSEADLISKLIPEEIGITLDEAIAKEPQLKELEESDPKVKQILKIARKLEGLFRHASIHAAGVIITNKPLVDYCPLYRGRDGEQVVQFDKDYSEKIGLVKFDFLGLKTLTVIDNAVKYVRRDLDPNFDIEAIDLEDAAVYKFVATGETIGVFQLESTGMRELCKRIAPDSLEDITAINALYRPGPLGSGMVDDFIEIKHGRKESTYPFQELIPVLKDTYGIITYQEQVMNIARILAGYTLGQADILRKAMGKKQKDVMDQHRQIFGKGAVERGFDQTKALELFDLMAKFAEYGFNKSHAVAYALIAYQTAFLKHYFPAQFFAALLSTELSNTDKVTAYIKDAKNFKITTLAPDINESLWHFNVVDGHIRFGLGAIKTVGQGPVNEILRERQARGPFKGLIDFCERVEKSCLNKRMLESMIRVGVFDGCEREMNRKTMLHNLEMILAYAARYQEEKSMGQTLLFAALDGGEQSFSRSLLQIEKQDEFDVREKLQSESELMGIYVSGHPLDRFEALMKQLSSIDIGDLLLLTGEEGPREFSLAGLLTNRRQHYTKKGDKMASALLEDTSGKVECLFFPRVFKEYESLIMTSQEPLLITGEVKNMAESPRRFFPSRVALLESVADERVEEIRIYCSLDRLHHHSLTKLKEMIQNHRGAVPAYLIFEKGENRARLPLGDSYLLAPSPRLAYQINELFQQNSVRFILKNSPSQPKQNQYNGNGNGNGHQRRYPKKDPK